MKNALIGYTGFVGSTLSKQTKFQSFFRSTNIKDIEGENYDLVICAGAPAQKWIANRDPEQDIEKINNLISSLKKVNCKTFVLISTVDVFDNPVGVDEDSQIDESGLNSYGLHRRYLEKFIQSNFTNHLIVRLPGLVGPGLKKNVIFDFLNDNNLDSIDSRGVFQFYPMVNLWYDIKIALLNNLKIIHLTSEPVSVSEISSKCFNKSFTQHLTGKHLIYDFRTKYFNLFKGFKNYQYKKNESILAIRSYAQSESISLK